MEPTKLVLMANQIALAFRLQPEPEKATAEHLRSFWSPSMRRELLAYVEAGGAELNAIATAAARLLRS
jgi:formate dehydrogenase subunit delta